jgi:hypothetical protein
MALYDRIKFTTVASPAPGTGPVTVGSAALGFQTPAGAGVTDGTQLIAYTIEDGVAWETGTGTYTSSGTTMTRTLSASSTGSLLNIAGSATMYFTPIATSLVQDIDNRLWGFFDSDFHLAATTSTNGPFSCLAVSGGVATATPTTSANHPGIVRVTSSATANSGWRATASDRILIGGGEIFDAILRPLTDMSTITMRCGYTETTSVADNVDGVYFEQVGSGAVVGKTASNSSRTQSSTIATLSTNTWYHFRITVNSNASSVKFEIFSDSGTLLGTQSITSDIPTARDTAAGFIVTSSLTVSTSIYDVDYMRFGSQRKLVRGAI